MSAPEWVRPGALVYYRPSGGKWDGLGRPTFAAVVDGDPVAVGSEYVVPLREIEAPYGRLYYQDPARNSSRGALVRNLEPRGVMTAAEVMREVMTADAAKLNAGRTLQRSQWTAQRVVVDEHGTIGPTPPLVTLCGSTRFRREFEAATYRFTLDGWIVLSVGCFGRSTHDHESRDGLTVEQKKKLDALHLKKIRMSQRVHVLNPGAYIGESTAREVASAFACGIPISFLDEDAGTRWLEEHSHELGIAVAEAVQTGGAR